MSGGPMNRRLWMVGAGVSACALAAGVGGPAAALVLAPLSSGGGKGAGRWIRTAIKIGDLEEGKPRRVPVVADRRDAYTTEKDVELGSVWLVRKGDAVTCYSTVCPHLGCFVNIEANGFACPCHASYFDGQGKRTTGPSPRDLDTLATKIEDGHVVVDFRRFRLGIAEKVET